MNIFRIPGLTLSKANLSLIRPRGRSTAEIPLGFIAPRRAEVDPNTGN